MPNSRFACRPLCFTGFWVFGFSLPSLPQSSISLFDLVLISLLWLGSVLFVFLGCVFVDLVFTLDYLPACSLVISAALFSWFSFSLMFFWLSPLVLVVACLVVVGCFPGFYLGCCLGCCCLGSVGCWFCFRLFLLPWFSGFCLGGVFFVAFWCLLFWLLLLVLVVACLVVAGCFPGFCLGCCLGCCCLGSVGCWFCFRLFLLPWFSGFCLGGVFFVSLCCLFFWLASWLVFSWFLCVWCLGFFLSLCSRPCALFFALVSLLFFLSPCYRDRQLSRTKCFRGQLLPVSNVNIHQC